MIRVLDLFCGCGGMSWGLHKASATFEIIAGIDNDTVALSTFSRNHPNAIATNADLSKIEPEQWLQDNAIDPEQIDCIIGGPPCQGFSKNVPRSQRFLADSRNLLVHKYLEFVRIIRPPLILMENVAEIVNAFDGAFTEEILGILSEWGYDTKVEILDAADFGVPQHRRRAFFFASLEKNIVFPKPTHYKEGEILPMFDGDKQSYITVWEAISDLPSLEHGEGHDGQAYVSTPQNHYQKWVRQSNTHIDNHIAKKLSSIQYERLSSLEAGEGAKELPEHLKPKKYYSGAYGRLTKNMVARTITRWMFHTGSGRYGHPVDIRTITIREAARLQSFTDDFAFEGSFTQASSQIGNSVPPRLAAAFSSIIYEHIKSSKFIHQGIQNPDKITE